MVGTRGHNGVSFILVDATDAFRYVDALRHVPEISVDGIVDKDPERRANLSQLLGAKAQKSCLQEMLDGNPSCDGVIVGNHDETSVENARMAIHNGMNVLLSLPRMSKSFEVKTLAEEAKAAQVCLMVSNTLRFVPSQQVLKARLDKGDLGVLGLVRAHRWIGKINNKNGPQCHMLSVPYLDLSNWLFDDVPQLIYARAIGSGYVQIHLGFVEGGMAIIDVSDDLPTGDGYQSVTVIGSNGAGYADDHHNRNLVFGGGTASAREVSEGNHDLVAEFKEFSAAIATKRAPSVTGFDAVKALQLAEAVASSVDSGMVLKRKGDRYE